MKRSLGFLLIPMLSAVSPLLALPAVTSVGGAQAWAAVAIGQSLGMAGATIVELGWGLTGPQRVARAANAKNRRRALAASYVSRVAMLLPVAMVVGLTAWKLSPEFAATSALVAVGTTAGGLTNAWYFIGTGRPSLVLFTDAVPRLLLVTASALLLVFAGAPMLVYPLVGILLPSLIAPVAGLWAAGVNRNDLAALTLRRVLKVIGVQRVALSGRLISALYIALPITLVTLAAPSAVPVFAAVERLQRMYLTILSAFPNSMQNWVGRQSSHRERFVISSKAILLNVLLGAAAGTAFALVAPYAAQLVFSGVVKIEWPLATLSGVLIFLVCVSRAVGGLALVAARRVHVVTRSAAVGATVGVPSILVLSATLGPAGGLIGEVIAESSVLAVQFSSWHSTRPRT